MEVQRPNLFQLEDGAGLSIAVHSQVPQYEYVCALIRASGGFVVEEASSADFCILSINISNVGAAAEELMSEGKLAIQDYWIRDSVDAASLLPWYSYQITPSSFASKDDSRGLTMTLARDIEERDVHELVIITARYGTLLSINELYRHISRRCPHRSIDSFKQLYETHRLEIESHILYIRKKLANALGPNNSFHRKPIISFESPNKHTPLRIQAAPAPSARHAPPTPTATATSRDEVMSPVRMPENSTVVRVTRDEPPSAPPNFDQPALPPSSSTPRQRSRESVAETSRGPNRRQDTESSDEAEAPTLRQHNSHPVPATKARGEPVTDEDKLALATFIANGSTKGLVWETAMVTFIKSYHRGTLRTPGSWRHVSGKRDVRNLVQRLSRGKGKAPLARQNLSESETCEEEDDYSSTQSRRRRPRQPSSKRLPHKEMQELCEKDKTALANWMIRNPREPGVLLGEYFTKFQAQHKTGSVRSALAWQYFASRHKHDLARIKGSKASRSPIRVWKSSASNSQVTVRSVTEEDKQALATWLLDHPRTGPQKAYFDAFRKQYLIIWFGALTNSPQQYKGGLSRSVGAWITIVWSIKEDLQARQLKLILERRKSYTDGKPRKSTERSPNRDVNARERIDNLDSDLSAIESD